MRPKDVGTMLTPLPCFWILENLGDPLPSSPKSLNAPTLRNTCSVLPAGLMNQHNCREGSDRMISWIHHFPPNWYNTKDRFSLLFIPWPAYVIHKRLLKDSVDLNWERISLLSINSLGVIAREEEEEPLSKGQGCIRTKHISILENRTYWEKAERTWLI